MHKRRRAQEIEEINPDDVGENRDEQEFLYGVLLHRYNYELELMRRLSSQSISQLTFALGAFGLILNLIVSPISSDRFSALPLDIILLLLFISFISFFFTVYYAIRVLWVTSGWGKFLKYPNDVNISILLQYHQQDEDLLHKIIYLNDNLQEIIMNNSCSNKKAVLKMRYGTLAFIFELFLLFLVILSLLISCYSN